jgi:hypothetical protein
MVGLFSVVDPLTTARRAFGGLRLPVGPALSGQPLE